jgi:iron complex outermembrane receptor protein
MATQLFAARRERRARPCGSRRKGGRLTRCALLSACALLFASAGCPRPAAAQAQPSASPVKSEGSNLLELPIEQLMNIEVTSVGKKPQRIAEAAAAISVITQDDIERSGMSSIPDLLRTVPGLDVAQADSRHWAVSSRGFNDIYSSKLLVLVDGRSVYTPLFSGVLWEEQVVPLQDIDRIEVIRGSGATLWGANAVNGVINVTTKSAFDTQGLMASATGGTDGFGSGYIRYGGTLSDKFAYRFFVEGSNHTAVVTPAGGGAGDGVQEERVGVRIDWTPSTADAVSVGGEYYRERMQAVMYLPSLLAPPTATNTAQHNSGGHALVSWNHRFSANSDIALQAYFDTALTEDYLAPVTVHTYDVEFRHHVQLGDRNDVVWGSGYRRVDFQETPSQYIFLVKRSGIDDTFNAFIQDEIELIRTVHLVSGVKAEHNTYVGWENEPSIRLVWEPTPDHTVWAAVSRAVRIPAIVDEFLRFNIAATPASPPYPPTMTAIVGSRGQRSERLTSWELGYRGALTSRLAVDIAAFYNDYTRLNSASLEPPVLELDPQPPHLLAVLRAGNKLSGETHGVEASATWQVTHQWKLTASYTLLRGALSTNNPTVSVILPSYGIGSSPHDQFQVRSHLDLPWRTQLDVAVYRVGALPAPDIPAYTRLDLHLGWRPMDHVAISLSAQNLLQARHQEFTPSYYGAPKEIPRAAYLTTTVEF